MRLALVLPGGVDVSGTYRVIPALLALIQRLAAEHDVQVFALRQGDRPANWDLAGARVHNIGRPNTRLRALAAIRRAHRVAPFDLVHSIWSGPCGLVTVAAARALGIPSVVHVAGGELVRLPEIAYGGCLRWSSRALERLVLRATSVVTAASTPVIASIAQFGVRAERVPLGVDLRAWPPQASRPRRMGVTARLVHVASLNRVKDQTTLLRALAALSRSGTDFEINIVGEDTLGGEIQLLAEHLRISDRVQFLGFVPQHNLRALVAASDLMIISSRHETGPVAMLEAAVVGVPTVGTAVGHILEWAPSATVSVPIGDPNALARAIKAVLSDESERLRLAQQAQQRALQEDADYTAACFQKIYRRLVP